MKKHQSLRRRYRLLIAIAICLLSILFGIIWQAVAIKIENIPSVGEYVHTDAYVMHYVSKGSGEAWSVVQNTLAGWSENSKQVTLSGSSHYLHWSNSDEVEAEIYAFIESIK